MVLGLVSRRGGAEREHARLGVLDVLHPHVDVRLCRVIGVGPLRPDVTFHALEGDAGPVGSVADDDEIRIVLHPHEAEQLLIERRERVGVLGVDHERVPASDRGVSLPETSDPQVVPFAPHLRRGPGSGCEAGEERLGARLTRVLEHLPRLALLHQHATVEEHHAGRDVPGE